MWCAAGKGTFGTDELIRQIEASGLDQVVAHRKLILPQLGAPGIAAHEVKRRSGFSVAYGPVRAEDLPAYLQSGKATPEMRTVRFPLRDRLVLIPVELIYVIFPWLIVAALLRSLPIIAAILAGVVLFPLLLPWLPTHNFSTKGWILGVITALPFALQALFHGPELTWINGGWALAALLVMPALTAFLALNFTGATTFTSRTGVRREIFRYIPAMAWSFGVGLVLMVGLSILKMGG